ncbi:MAG: thymidylate synthase [Patescibacteria group bacterium]
MFTYQKGLKKVHKKGIIKKGPQAHPTYFYPGVEMRFNLRRGFPLLTIRSLKGSWNAIISELLWILSGSTNAYELRDNYGVKQLWQNYIGPCTALHAKNRYKGRAPGELGPIYGHQMRNHGATMRKDGTFKNDGLDQLNMIVQMLKVMPENRRIMATTWNLRDCNDDKDVTKEKTYIVPCHGSQLHFSAPQDPGNPKRRLLNLVHFQRSGDMPIGIPFNIAEYALLMFLIGKITGYVPNELIHFVSDAQIYSNQVPWIDPLLAPKPLALPTVTVPDISDLSIGTIKELKASDFGLHDYNPHPAIKDIPVEL